MTAAGAGADEYRILTVFDPHKVALIDVLASRLPYIVLDREGHHVTSAYTLRGARRAARNHAAQQARGRKLVEVMEASKGTEA